MGQTIALTTDDKLALLRRAWQLAPEGANTLVETIQSRIADAHEVLEENVSSSASNSHSATDNAPGSNRPTDQETLRGWQQVLNGAKTARQYLLNCAKYGLDAFVIFRNTRFPNPLPTPLAADLRVIVDSLGQWADLVELEADPFATAALVIGVTVSDAAVYLWLLSHPQLLNKSSDITESRGDYSQAIIGRGGMLA